LIVSAFEDPENPDVISFEFDENNPDDMVLRLRITLLGLVAANPEYNPIGYYLVATDEIRNQINTLCELISDLMITGHDEKVANEETSTGDLISISEEDQPLFDALLEALRVSSLRMETIMKRKMKAGDMDHLTEALQDGRADTCCCSSDSGCSECGSEPEEQPEHSA
jgi:hypothetical protein